MEVIKRILLHSELNTTAVIAAQLLIVLFERVIFAAPWIVTYLMIFKFIFFLWSTTNLMSLWTHVRVQNITINIPTKQHWITFLSDGIPLSLTLTHTHTLSTLAGSKKHCIQQEWRDKVTLLDWTEVNMDASCYLLYALQTRINLTFQLFTVLQSYLLWTTWGVEEGDFIFLLRGHLLLFLFYFCLFFLSFKERSACLKLWSVH